MIYKNKLQQLTSLILRLDEYLKTVQKSIAWDGDNQEKFENHYWDVMDEAINLNWQIHNIVEELEREEIRKEIKLEICQRSNSHES